MIRHLTEIALLALAAAVLGACSEAGGVPPTVDSCPPAVSEPEVQQVVAAASCDGYGEDVTAGAAFDRSGTALRREETWGCGCPSRPSFTLAYEPGTSPLRVRLCYDATADTCEALCQRELGWDLCGALAAEGADALEVVAE